MLVSRLRHDNPRLYFIASTWGNTLPVRTIIVFCFNGFPSAWPSQFSILSWCSCGKTWNNSLFIRRLTTHLVLFAVSVVLTRLFFYGWIIGDWWRVLWSWLIYLVFTSIYFLAFLTFWRLCMEQLWGWGTWSRDGHKQYMLWCVSMVQDQDPLYLIPCPIFLSYPLEGPPHVLHTNSLQSCLVWFLLPQISGLMDGRSYYLVSIPCMWG